VEKKAAAEKASADKAVVDKERQAAAQKAAVEKIAAEKEKQAAAQKAAAERLAADRADKAAAAEKQKADRAAADKERADKNAAERAAAGGELTTPRGGKPVESTSVIQLAAQDKLVGGQRFQLELERQDAKRRIVPNPPKGVADLTDDEVVDVWIRLRDDQDALNWMILGYQDGSDNAIKVLGKGTGGFQEMKDAVPDSPVFLYLRYLFGDTGRSKFVFLTYVPDSLSGLKKARVVQHRPAVTKFIKYFQIEWHLLRREELVLETLEKKLLAAGGANYSVQAEDKGDFKNYKGTTATFHGIKQ